MALPKENLDNKTFREFVEEARSRIPIYAPKWTDHNLHDPGITIIELLACLSEMQLYYLNRITKKSYLKFLKLLGIQDESLEKALSLVRQDIKSITRAVTDSDYLHLVLNLQKPAVALAKVISGYHTAMKYRVPGIVTVVVVPENLVMPANKNDSPDISKEFLKDVYCYLNKYRMLTTELFVIPPDFLGVSVEVTVTVKPEFLKSTVENNIINALNTFLHPLKGGADGKGWPFGRDIYISEIYEVIDRVKGVEYISTVTLNKNGSDIKVSDHQLVYPYDHTITIEEK